MNGFIAILKTLKFESFNNKIKFLFKWSIQVRVLFVFPMKTFINKKGVESFLKNIEIGDKSGTIECTMFGDVAQKFDGKLIEDNVY